MADQFGRAPVCSGSGDRDGCEDSTTVRTSRSGTDPTGRNSPYRAVESYLDYNAERFAGRFDANAYLYLSRAMEDYDLAADAEGDAAALSGFDGRATVISIAGDWHFTVEQSRRLAAAFRAAGVAVTHEVLDSEYGHDAFLAEPDRVGSPIAAALDGAPGTGRSGPPVHAGLCRRVPDAPG